MILMFDNMKNRIAFCPVFPEIHKNNRMRNNKRELERVLFFEFDGT